MIAGAVRARLIELRRTLASARSGRDVLEQKRQLVLEEMRRRAASAAQRRPLVGESLARARSLLLQARVDISSPGVDAAVLAHTRTYICTSANVAYPPTLPALDRREALLLGVRVPRVTLRAAPFRPAYGPGGTSQSLDRAGAAYTALLADLGPLVDDEAAAAALRRGLLATARLLGAIEKVVIPRLEQEIREVTQGLEEEERDEITRRARWLTAHAVDAGRTGQSIDRLALTGSLTGY